jgi:5S rRNA maturation endonuclease (ribonuclease M5)
MKLNPQLKNQIEKYKDYVIIVEGKKDLHALKQFGFEKVYVLHKTSIPLRERVEQIMSNTDKKDKICILTDLDKKGKKLYIFIKPIFQELGAKLDSSLREILIKSKISHIEGMGKFMQQIESIK